MDEEKNVQEIPSQEEEQEQQVSDDLNELPAEDDFIIGKGFTIEEPAEETDPTVTGEETGKPKKSGKKKKSKGIIGALIRVVLILIISGGLAFGFLYAGADYLGITFGEAKDITFIIEEGTSVQRIAGILKEEGVIKLPVLFRLYAKLKHYEGDFQCGRHTFNTEDSYADIAAELSVKGKNENQKMVGIPEGYALDEIAKKFETEGICTAADFIEEAQHGNFSYDFVKEIPAEKVYYRLEGYLFPETLSYYCCDPESGSDSRECAHMAIDKMLGELDEKLTDEVMEKVKKSGYTLHEIMTIASIIELESSGDKTEMANVSAVFHNRLKSDEFAKLQSSPTVKYPHGSGKYDTYQSEGLPPGPLCSPSLDAIKAALEPTPDFEYYYFVTDAKMKFYYNKTLAEHNNTIARLKKENNWIGDQ